MQWTKFKAFYAEKISTKTQTLTGSIIGIVNIIFYLHQILKYFADNINENLIIKKV